MEGAQRALSQTAEHTAPGEDFLSLSPYSLNTPYMPSKPHRLPGASEAPPRPLGSSRSNSCQFGVGLWLQATL